MSQSSTKLWPFLVFIDLLQLRGQLELQNLENWSESSPLVLITGFANNDNRRRVVSYDINAGNEPTQEEHEQKAITKLRYMQVGNSSISPISYKCF